MCCSGETGRGPRVPNPVRLPPHGLSGRGRVLQLCPNQLHTSFAVRVPQPCKSLQRLQHGEIHFCHRPSLGTLGTGLGHGRSHAAPQHLTVPPPPAGRRRPPTPVPHAVTRDVHLSPPWPCKHPLPSPAPVPACGPAAARGGGAGAAGGHA